MEPRDPETRATVKALVRGCIYGWRVFVLMLVGLLFGCVTFCLLVGHVAQLMWAAPFVWYYQCEEWAFGKESSRKTLEARHRFYEDLFAFRLLKLSALPSAMEELKYFVRNGKPPEEAK